MGILNTFKTSKCTHRVLAAVATTLGVGFLTTTPVLAQDLSPITTMLTTIGTALTGPLGRAAGLVALAACGFLFMTGRMSWPFAGSIVIGLAILFGSAAILSGFA